MKKEYLWIGLKTLIGCWLIYWVVDTFLFVSIYRFGELIKLIPELEMPHYFYGLAVFTWLGFTIISMVINLALKILELDVIRKSNGGRNNE